MCVADHALAEKLLSQRQYIGAVPCSLEVWLLLRSLRTLTLRLDRHCSTATAIAAWLHTSIGDINHKLHGLIVKVHRKNDSFIY